MQSAGTDRLVLTKSTEEAARRRGTAAWRERERDLCLGCLVFVSSRAGVGRSTPHFHARRQEKQTGPCSAVTW